ncbi:MAG TPA: adenylate/guanylate cyclase domain-containing protein [Gaiellaceae bacterium]|nr:adenylate/guanylate cyclase domain-containing protein [Gaiellaceae bacterium]
MALDIRYARSGGVSIAYQVVGDGDVDLVYVPDYVSNLVYGWETPSWRRFYERLAERFRLILFDKRGTGLSDLGGHFPALETRMDDVRAVLDSVGSTSTVLLGSHDGCSMAVLYAATYPERTRALVLFHPVAHDPDLENPASLDELAALRDEWGTQEFADELLEEGAPSLYADPDEREWFANWLRVGASPSVAYALNRAWFETDLRNVLPSVRVPTLVLYRQDTPLDLTRDAEEHARDVATQIRGARLLRVSGRDRFPIFLSTEIPDEVERFVAGEAVPEVPDTVLATVLFTDIVGSTEQAAELGDRRWRELLERHNALVRRELTRFRGEEKDTAGDGFFATFDGPARAIRCADAIAGGVHDLGLEVRAGVHTGECELHEGKVAGLAVVIGARVAAAAQGGEVLVSQTVKDLVAGAGLEFEERGEHELKGVPGTWRLYAVAR